MITGQMISFILCCSAKRTIYTRPRIEPSYPAGGGGWGRYLPARPAAAGGGIPLVLVGVAGPGFLNSRPASSAGLSHVDNPDQSIQFMFITDCNFIALSWGGFFLSEPESLYLSRFRFGIHKSARS